jgi:hypothetical protein
LRYHDLNLSSAAFFFSQSSHPSKFFKSYYELIAARDHKNSVAVGQCPTATEAIFQEANHEV